MYFMVNTAFTNYIDQFNLTEDLKSIFLINTKFDDSLFTTPQTLRDYIAQYKHEKEIFDLKESIIWTN